MVAILSVFGVETTTFAGLLAAAGVAIGMAWSGMKAQLAHGVDHADAIERLRAAISQIPNVQADPAPDFELLEFNLAGPVLAVRPYCHTDHYWQVYFDTNKAIREVFGDAGYPVPEQHYKIAQG